MRRRTKKPDEVIGNVYKTKDYTKFHFGVNRDIKYSEVNKIARSMKKHGWLGAAILVTDDYEIIDGQHRYVAAMRANATLRYTFSEKYSVEETSDMNNAQHKWGDMDYCIAYAKAGNENYINYVSLCNKYTSKSSLKLVPPNVIAYAVTHDINSSNSKAAIRAGKLQFSLDDYEVAVDKLDYAEDCYKLLNEVKQTTKKSFGRKDYFGNAILFMIEHGVDRTNLYEAIKRRIGYYIPTVTIETALEQLEAIYNYRKPTKNKIYIMSEYQRFQDERKLAKEAKRKLEYKKEKEETATEVETDTEVETSIETSAEVDTEPATDMNM